MNYEVDSEILGLLRENKAFIFRNVTFADFKRALEEEFGSGAIIILYEAGRKCGERSYGRFSKETLKVEELLARLARYKHGERWGDLKFKLDLSTGEGEVDVYECFEARAYGSSKVPVCHFMRGFLEGFLSKALQHSLTIKEVACIAEGKEFCRFKVSKKTS